MCCWNIFFTIVAQNEEDVGGLIVSNIGVPGHLSSHRCTQTPFGLWMCLTPHLDQSLWAWEWNYSYPFDKPKVAYVENCKINSLTDFEYLVPIAWSTRSVEIFFNFSCWSMIMNIFDSFAENANKASMLCRNLGFFFFFNIWSRLFTPTLPSFSPLDHQSTRG